MNNEKEIEKLREELGCDLDELPTAIAQLILDLESDNEKLKEALQFYGDRHTYQGLLYRDTICSQCQKPPGWNGEIIFKDCGQKAREALGKE